MIKQKITPGRPLIDLDGPEGNVYQILAMASNFCTQLNMDYNKFHAEVTFFAMHYEDVIVLFDQWFGDYCDLETSQEYLLEIFDK